MTNWEKHFSTPEKAASFLDEVAGSCSFCVVIDLLRKRDTCCKANEFDAGCPYNSSRGCSLDHLEWLNKEADHD